MITLQNLKTTSHRKSGESKYDRKLTELDVVTTRIRYRVNHRDYKRIEVASGDESRNKLNKSNGGQI